MSQSWKRQGSSFNNLVKSTKIVGVVDHAFHNYVLPDASGTAVPATEATGFIEFQKVAAGIEASANLFFQDSYDGVDASCEFFFSDVSGSVGKAIIKFQDASTNNSDVSQNIIIRDLSGESLKFILDVDRVIPAIPQSYDISYAYAPGEDPDTTLGAVIVPMGTDPPPTGNASKQIRAFLFSRATNGHFDSTTIPAVSDYPRLEIAGYTVTSASSEYIRISQNHPGILGNTDISYVPLPYLGEDGTWGGTENWTPIEKFLIGTDGSFNGGFDSLDCSVNVLLKDTSGETIVIELSVDGSNIPCAASTATSFPPGPLPAVDGSWNFGAANEYNTDPSGSLGRITIGIGRFTYDPATDLTGPTGSERAAQFIKAIAGPWQDESTTDPTKPPFTGIEITAIQDGSRVILTQDYGGSAGNRDISFNQDISGASCWLPIRGFPLDPSSERKFTGGTDASDSSLNVVLTDISGDFITFVLNTDLSCNATIESGTWPYPFHAPVWDNDVSNVLMVGIGGNVSDASNGGFKERVTGEERAEQFSRAVNNTPIKIAPPDPFPLYITAELSGNMVKLTQQVPGTSGNQIPIYFAQGPINLPSYLTVGTWPIDVPIHPVPEGPPFEFSGGITPIDSSQNLTMTDTCGNTTVFYLDVDISLAQIPTASGGNDWVVPMGKGEGSLSANIAISDVSRCAQFKRVLDDPTFTLGISGEIAESETGSGAKTRITLHQAIPGADGNTGVLYVPNPNVTLPNPAAYPDGFQFPLKPLFQGPGVTTYYNTKDRMIGGGDEQLPYDTMVRTQSTIIIKGGQSIQVVGDQDENTIIINNTQPDASQATVWVTGKGAGTSQSGSYNIQAINPGMNTGLYGAAGDYAIAAGERCKSLGEASFSTGSDCIAEGNQSTALGKDCQATGEQCVALGNNSDATINYSTAIGYKGETKLIPDPAHEFPATSNGIVFAIGSQDGIDTFGAPGGNILEVDTEGRLWTKNLGQLSEQVVVFKRQDPDDVDSGIIPKVSDNTPYAGGKRSIAIGYNARVEAAAVSGFADGSGCSVGATYGVAFGENAIINPDAVNAFVAGKDCTVRYPYGVAFGRECNSSLASFTSGYKNDASGAYSVAMGIGNIVDGQFSVGMGAANYTFGESSTSIGRNNRTVGFAGVALGCNCEASGNFSVAIGKDCSVNGLEAAAIGSDSVCTTDAFYSIALGKGSYCYGANSLAALGGISTCLNSIIIGSDCSNTNTTSGGGESQGAIAMGEFCHVHGLNGIAMGRNNVSGHYSTAFGANNNAVGRGGFVHGEDCSANNDYGYAGGFQSDSSGTASMALGYNCHASSWLDPSGWLDTTLPNDDTTICSIALGQMGYTSLDAPYIGGNPPSNVAHTNPQQYRKEHKGIVMAIGAEGEGHWPDISLNTHPNGADSTAGNIMELYADGTIWTAAFGELINPADASAVKWSYVGEPFITPLVIEGAANTGTGFGALAGGADNTVEGDYSFSVGRGNRTDYDASFAVTIGSDCSANGRYSVAIGKNCDASNNFSFALGNGASTGETSSGGDLSANRLIFSLAAGSGNVVEIDGSGMIWTQALGRLETPLNGPGAIPIGGVIAWAGTLSTLPPANWLWCDGAGYSHIDNPAYTNLFMTIGNTYGTDSSGGFLVPNMEGSGPIGIDDFSNVSTVGDDGTGAGAGGSAGPPPTTGNMRWIIRYR